MGQFFVVECPTLLGHHGLFIKRSINWFIFFKFKKARQIGKPPGLFENVAAKRIEVRLL